MTLQKLHPCLRHFEVNQEARLATMMQDEDRCYGLLHVDTADTMAHGWQKVPRWNVRNVTAAAASDVFAPLSASLVRCHWLVVWLSGLPVPERE